MRPPHRPALVPALGLALAAACSGEDPVFIAQRWSYAPGGMAAPPGLGPEKRAVVIERSAPSHLATINEQNGLRVEGPFDAFPSEHAPVVSASTLYFVSSIGKLVGLSFAGETRVQKPDGTALGLSSPPALAPDGSLRLGTTSGRLLGFRASDGETLFDVSAGGAIASPLAIAADGTTYAATDTGRLIGVDSAGSVVLDVSVHAPASGPSVSADGATVVVGELDGARAFDRSGAERFTHPRGARVVGTRALSGGGFVAWGEDGVVEILDATGAVSASYTAGPPIYANVLETKAGDLAVVDSNGVARTVGRDGVEKAKLALGEAPLTELSIGELGFVFLSVGGTVKALDFSAR